MYYISCSQKYYTGGVTKSVCDNVSVANLYRAVVLSDGVAPFVSSPSSISETAAASQKLASGYSSLGCGAEQSLCTSAPGATYPESLAYGAYPASYPGMDSYMQSVNKSRPPPYSRSTDYPTYLSRVAGLSGATTRHNGVTYDSHYGTG